MREGIGFANTERGARIAAGIKRANRKRAEERIARGLPIGGPGSYAGLTITQRVLQNTIDEKRRQADPVEQALTKLRRDRIIIYRASVHEGGRHDQFIMHRKSGPTVISEAEVLRMAGRL